MAEKKQVRVGKIDLDTVGAAYLLGVNREDEVQVVRGEATPEDLTNPNVICIEVGGSGQTQLNNWDHHGKGVQNSATLQVIEEMYGGSGTRLQYRLVQYINILDTKGPEGLSQKSEELFPTLSDVFAGMLLTERDPVEQLQKGIEILKAVEGSEQDPFGRITGFDSYAKAKAENNRQIVKAVEQAQRTITQSGLKLGYLETEFFGAPGALYGVGAQVVVVLNPNLNGVRKFTVAGNGIRVDAVKAQLDARELGWGGPATGTILGSPREGSNLSLEEVVKIVKETL